MSAVFAGRLREARLALGMSQAALALEIGLGGRQAIEAYECSRVQPKLDMIELLAIVLGTSPIWLAGWVWLE